MQDQNFALSVGQGVQLRADKRHQIAVVAGLGLYGRGPFVFQPLQLPLFTVAAPQAAAAQVQNNPVQPRPKIGVPAEGVHRSIGQHERVLHPVFGLLQGRREAAAQFKNPGHVAPNEIVESVPLAQLRPGDQFRVHRFARLLDHNLRRLRPRRVKAGFAVGPLGFVLLPRYHMEAAMKLRKLVLYQAAVYFIVRLAVGLAQALGFGFTESACRALACVAEWLDRRHRRMADENLREAIRRRGLSWDARQIRREMFDHLGRLTAEFLFAPVWVRRRQIQKLVALENTHILEAALARGRGAILMTGHLGNWELAALAVGQAGFPLCTVTREIKNRFLDRYVHEARMLGHHQLLAQYGSLDRFSRVLRENKVLGVLLDQRAGSHGFVVDFFGRPAPATLGPALLAQRYGAPIIPLRIRRAGRRHIVTFDPPIEPAAFGRSREAAMKITQECTRVLERYILQTPSQWPWIYRRWTMKPESLTTTRLLRESQGPVGTSTPSV